MTKEKLLFVTKGGEDCDNGFTYILELAKTLNAGIAMLMVYNKRVLDTYEDVMAAVAFAEAGDLETVKELMQTQERVIKETAEKKIGEMTEKCRENSVSFTYQIAAGDALLAPVGLDGEFDNGWVDGDDQRCRSAGVGRVCEPDHEA